jgi:hypothetical protein
MAARETDGEIHPLVERHGIMRQFATAQFDARPEMARTNRMFVVGNPKTLLWPSLSGAEQEAKAVAKVAEAHAVTVTYPQRDARRRGSHPDRDAERIVTSLMTGEYQIIHIAAHGQYDPDPMRSGVVMSDRIFFTPAEVTRLPRVPELVFLNCCYLGQMGQPGPSSPDPRLASSLAEGFIRAGVRAVIAAGWAVDDKAGKTFATTFYEAFLSGVSFGAAVKAAREETRHRHRSTTWGAYQCYGNPDFSFGERQTPKRTADPVTLVTSNESLGALRTLASIARSMRFDDVAWVTDQLNATLGEASKAAMLGVIPQTMLKDGNLLAAAGDAAGELDLFENAIAFYDRALAAEKASAPFAAIEQLANLMARNAATKIAATGRVDEQTRKAFVEAEQWLDWLDQKLPKTPERRALRGSLYKRMAASLPDLRTQCLEKARDTYGIDPADAAAYQSLNALAIAFALADRSMLPALVERADEFWKALPGQQPGPDRDFWDVVKFPDTMLHRHVLRQSLDAPALAELTVSYAQACHARPSPRQWASVTDHVFFLQAMTADARLPCHNPATSAMLRELHTVLTTRDFESAVAGTTSAARKGRTNTATTKAATKARTRRPGKSSRARPLRRRPRR